MGTLKRAIRRLPLENQAELRAFIDDILTPQPSPDIRLGWLRDKMALCTGIDVCQKSNLPAPVRARTVFCYVCRQEGFSLKEIARFLHKDHTTVFMCEKRMREAFITPGYADYLTLHKKFTKKLSCKKN